MRETQRVKGLRSKLSPKECYAGLYELRTKFRLGGPTGDYIGFWEGRIKGYTTNLVQVSYREC